MKKKTVFFLLTLLLAGLCLTGCKGSKLPEGMNMDAMMERGEELITLLNEDEWQTVYDQLREDGKETTSVEQIKVCFKGVTSKAGAYVRTEDTLTTGQKIEDTGEQYGTAVFYCKHEKDDVVYRFAFSTEMELMGFQVSKK